jgi:hypothetical protein
MLKDTSKLLSQARLINLDLDFIKKLFYYNKNLEEFLETRLKDNAHLKNLDIETCLVTQYIYKL